MENTRIYILSKLTFIKDVVLGPLSYQALVAIIILAWNWGLDLILMHYFQKSIFTTIHIFIFQFIPFNMLKQKINAYIIILVKGPF